MSSILQRAVELAGGQTALAKRIGKTQGHISKWLQRDFIPPDAVLAIERATGIPRHELRPDIYPPVDIGFAEAASPITSKDLIGRKWSVAEIDGLERAGMLVESDRFELIDGQIVPMNAKGNRHEIYKGSLLDFWVRNRSSKYRIIQETTFRLDSLTYVVPDFVFYEAKVTREKLAPSNTWLAVEISETSLGYDLGRKPGIYARASVKALWVIDVNTLNTHQFSQPVEDVYQVKQTLGPKEVLVPDFAPELALTLDGLELI